MIRQRVHFETQFRILDVEQLEYKIEPVHDVHKSYITSLRSIATYDGTNRFLQDMKRRIYEPPYESLYALFIYGHKNSREKLVSYEVYRQILQRNGKICQCALVRRGLICPEILTIWDKRFICSLCNAGPFHENCARLHFCNVNDLSEIDHANSEHSPNDAIPADEIFEEENTHIEECDYLQAYQESSDKTNELQTSETHEEDATGSEEEHDKIIFNDSRKIENAKKKNNKNNKKRRSKFTVVDDYEIEDDEDNDPDYNANFNPKRKSRKQ